jgi:hypothetical protein
MKPFILVTLGLILSGCTDSRPTPADPERYSPPPAVLGDLPPQVRSFIVQKQEQGLALAKKLGVTPDRATLEYFQLAREGRYRAASKIYQDLRERGGKVESKKYDPNLRLPLWDPLLEVQLTLDAYAAGAGKFATAFGEGIAQSIPPGSIYFGGTDTGRGLVAAFSKSSAGTNRFFVLTQNQLSDGQHLKCFARAAYSKLRSSQAGLYAWRLGNAISPEEQRRMVEAAEFAFRQSFAFCPTNPEAVYGYVNLLLQTGHADDAVLIARTVRQLEPADKQSEDLLLKLERIKNTGGG